MHLFSWLHSPRVTVYVDPAQFSFQMGTFGGSYPTTVYMYEESGRTRLNVLGGPASPFAGSPQWLAGATACHLFAPYEGPRQDPERIFVAYVRLCMQRSLGRGLVCAPTYVLHGADSLADRVGGYQRPLLVQMFRQAGAYRVEFAAD